MNWTGWHAGAYGGYLSGKVNSNDLTHELTTGTYKDDGPLAGIYGGYRHQNANGLVLGADVVLPVYMFTGSAVDTVYFPGLVRYEADPRYGAFVDAHVGRAMGKALPYVFGAVGLASTNGKTLNVDNSDSYSPGFVQSAVATHLIWQGGIGMDDRMGRKVYVGGRVAAFMGARADHTMSWNEPGPNDFGYRAALLQMNLGYGY